LTQEENLAGLAAINRELIAKAEAVDSPQRVVLDMDSTEIPVKTMRFEVDSCTIKKKKMGGARMKNELLVVVTVAVCLLMVAGTMSAHHSPSLYDKQHPIKLTGTVTEFRFINPHIQIHFEVMDENGNVVKWIAHSSPPSKMYRRGWNRNILKPGDQITVTGGGRQRGQKKHATS